MAWVRSTAVPFAGGEVARPAVDGKDCCAHARSEKNITRATKALRVRISLSIKRILPVSLTSFPADLPRPITILGTGTHRATKIPDGFETSRHILIEFPFRNPRKFWRDLFETGIIIWLKTLASHFDALHVVILSRLPLTAAQNSSAFFGVIMMYRRKPDRLSTTYGPRILLPRNNTRQVCLRIVEHTWPNVARLTSRIFLESHFQTGSKLNSSRYTPSGPIRYP
jgi:hypothetical protein